MSERPFNPGRLPELLGWRLTQARVIAEAVFNAEVSEPVGLRPVELSMLELLRANPGIAPAQLARALSISRPQATQVLDRLEARQLAQRTPSGTDGRGLAVHATESGKRCARNALERLQAAELAMLAKLSTAERAMLMELLAKLAP